MTSNSLPDCRHFLFPRLPFHYSLGSSFPVYISSLRCFLFITFKATRCFLLPPVAAELEKENFELEIKTRVTAELEESLGGRQQGRKGNGFETG
jgi:hypothetical protein